MGGESNHGDQGTDGDHQQEFQSGIGVRRPPPYSVVKNTVDMV
jgi:hypothetical protein